MTTTDTINAILQQARTLLPTGELGGELEKNLRAILQSQLAKLDVVSRAEFEAQTAVLGRCREKIDALERQLAELEDQQTG